VPRMISRHALALVMICATARAAHGLTQTATQTTPATSAQTQSQRQLDQVREALRTIDVSPQTDAGQRIASLKDHFSDLAASYLVPSSRSVDAASAAPTAVGTAGSASAGEGGWRAKYRTVENDLSGLIGPSDAPSKDAELLQLDPRIRRQLEDIRTRLQAFYAGTMSDPAANPVAHTGAPSPTSAETPFSAPPIAPTGAAPLTPSPVAPSMPSTPAASAAPAAVPGTSPVVDRDMGTSIALLDRIQRILDDATKNPMGKVSIDRPAIDEIRADVAQIKTTLQARQQ
jgi:hypothetical protein